MALFQKDKWLTWARAWGLTHYPQKNWMYRDEQVVGMRNGYLISAGWGGNKNAALIVRVRFPEAADLEAIRRALIGDASLDQLPGKGKARAKTVLAIGPEKQIQWTAIPEFTLRDGSLIWYRVFAWGAPKPDQVSRWIDLLVAAVGRAVPAFDGRCEKCKNTQVRQFVFVDQVPKLLCGTCQERLRSERQMAEQTYDMMEARHLNGALLGLAGAAGGAMLWALIAGATGRILAAAAIGIGWLVAALYRKGAGRVDLAGQVIGAVLTVGAVVAGQVLFYAWSVLQVRPDAGFRLASGWFVYLALWTKDPGTEIIALVFGLLGAIVSFGMLKRRPQGAVLRTADQDPREGIGKAA